MEHTGNMNCLVCFSLPSIKGHSGATFKSISDASGLSLSTIKRWSRQPVLSHDQLYPIVSALAPPGSISEVNAASGRTTLLYGCAAILLAVGQGLTRQAPLSSAIIGSSLLPIWLKSQPALISSRIGEWYDLVDGKLSEVTFSMISRRNPSELVVWSTRGNSYDMRLRHIVPGFVRSDAIDRGPSVT